VKNKFKSKTNLALLSLLIALIFAIGCAQSTPAEPINEADVDWEFYNGRAEVFIKATAGGEYERAVENFSRAMMRGFGAKGLEDAWAQIIVTAGEFIEINEIMNAVRDGYLISGVIMQHENYGYAWNITFSTEGIIEGLWSGGTIPLSELKGASQESATATERDGFTDYPVIIGEGTDFPLNGILSIPDDAQGQVPAVVMVHGSGASNMDGVPAALPNFPNKPFRDIADHLAANGIAVIRYDKRTLIHGMRMPQDFTVWEETIEDALLAAEILRADPRVDENRVFIIGHSMGGMLAPRIHAEGGDFAGLILLAGSPRSLLDIIRDQNIDYVNENMTGAEKEAALATLTEESWNELVTQPILNMPEDEARRTPSGFGATVYYDQDWLNHPAETFIRAINQPFLILQGSTDFQVTVDRDFAVYQELFAQRSNATLKVYEGLNHLFMVSTTGTIDEYSIPATVDGQVLADIVDWIKAQ